ncbi:DUF3991 domain-containing protein [Listeria rocourtiae]|uniref:DUF3991 domain-containing protein n=1 Tax=Listeria rocourtiae TaxID=647910 RepID=UPI001627D8D9|nr:DUF3991 domain-containing protein [Listeria rocourtiae]MBC1604485.1 DUF3991 domain-containing protein [Listeria rocourtiae]
MEKVQKIPPELVDKAANVDIIEYIQSEGNGGLLQKKGKYYHYKFEDHGSIVIDSFKNYFIHNATGEAGNAISFIQYFEKLPFRQAVEKLVGNEYKPAVKREPQKQQPFSYYFKDKKSTAKARQYLVEERKLDAELVDTLIAKGFIRQAGEDDDIIFVWTENGKENGKIVGASEQGTIRNQELHGSRGTKKKVAANVAPNTGFNVVLGAPKKLFLFEAPIDALSFWSMNKHLTDCRIIAMTGLQKQVVTHYIAATYKQYGLFPENVYVGADNDPAGHRFADKYVYDPGYETPDGKTLSYKPLLVGDHQIPEWYLEKYKEVAEAHFIPWEILAAIHKAETNFLDTNEITNGFKVGRYFGKQLKAREKPTIIDVDACLERCAIALKDVSPNSRASLESFLKEEDIATGDMLSYVDKVEHYYNLYVGKGFEEVSDHPLKDWNEKRQEDALNDRIDRTTPLNQEGFALSEAFYELQQDMSEPKAFQYYLSNADNAEHVYKHLVNHYGLDKEIVAALLQKGMIREDSYHRAVFLWGKQGTVVGGDILGTEFDKKRFGKEGVENKIMANSQSNYGFNVKIGQPDTVYFFTNPVELMSFWTLYRNQIQNAKLMSMSGFEQETVMKELRTTLRAGGRIKEMHLCVSRDSKGMEFLDQFAQHALYQADKKVLKTAEGYEDIKIKSNLPRFGKNWSDELQVKRERHQRVTEYYQRQQQQQARESMPAHTVER